MKTLEHVAGRSWCESRGYAFDARGLPVLRHGDGLQQFVIPPDAGQRVAMAKQQMEIFRKEDDVCIWIYDWDVWPSGQWEHLFHRFRLSYGITEGLAERSWHLVPKSDFDAALSIAIYSVLMLWDCHVFGSSGTPFLFYSHDEIGRKTG
jgi:hypothetical protein